MRLVVLACLLLACGDSKTVEPAPTTLASPDETLVDRWFVAMEKQLLADATALSKRTFASESEAQEALLRMTPAGFEPRPEFFQPLFDEVPKEQMAKRLSSYAEAHADEMEKRGAAMMMRLEPAMKRAFDNVQTYVKH